MNEEIEFICLGSGSSGNAYIFKKNNECVLVEAGFDWSILLKKLIMANVEIHEIKSVIVTHRHNDHIKSLDRFVKLGIDCYVPVDENLSYLSVYNNVHFMENKPYELASWLKVIPFDVCHDVPAKGFMFLDTETRKSILFINDTKLFDPLKLANITFDYIFIECNHIRKVLEAIMQTALDNGNEGEVFKLKRQSAYHMSLASCKKFLKKLPLQNTQAIFLMHLSKDCANKDIIRSEINETFNIKTLVCETNGGFY